MRASFAIFSLPLLVPCFGRAQNTLYVACDHDAKPKHVASAVSYSNDKKWRAYVDVEVRSDAGCTYTTRLWVGAADGQYQAAFVIPPEQYAYGNGMEILSWQKSGSVLLVRTDQWQEGSDALDDPGVLAIDARTGLVYKPGLSAMMEHRKRDRCYMRILDAALAPGKSVNITVRAQFKTYIDVDETKKDVPPAPNCNDTEETWSFDFKTGRIRKVSRTEPVAAVGAINRPALASPGPAAASPG